MDLERISERISEQILERIPDQISDWIWERIWERIGQDWIEAVNQKEAKMVIRKKLSKINGDGKGKLVDVKKMPGK